VYRRLEMRGDLRGGRIVGGFVGEQFAAPEALEALRAIRREEPSGQTVRISACDPLNLVGIITPGPRVPAVPGHHVSYRDGVPVLEETRTRGERAGGRKDPNRDWIPATSRSTAGARAAGLAQHAVVRCRSSRAPPASGLPRGGTGRRWRPLLAQVERRGFVCAGAIPALASTIRPKRASWLPRARAYRLW
jgi:hypothetical protein